MTVRGIHRELVAKLVASGASTKGFRQAILTAGWGERGTHEVIVIDQDDPDGSYEDCDRCLFDAELNEFRQAIPDAYRIDSKNLEVIAYEVEVTSRLSEAKMETYRAWWWILDEEEWLLRLIVVDRFGNEHEIDLLANDLEASSGRKLQPGELEQVRDTMGIRAPGTELPLEEEP